MSKPFAWSFSALDTFESCNKKYYHLKVLKKGDPDFFKDSDSDASIDGKFIHQAMFERVINKTPLPIQLRQHEAIAGRFANAEGEKHGEMKLALNGAFQPRDFFAKDVWVRAVVDLLIVRGDTAILVDWKTGKKKVRWDQLHLSAAVLSLYMPEVNHFNLVFAWLKDADFSTAVLEKEEMKGVWLNYLPRVNVITDAIKTTTFPANQTPLCGWCPVTSCPHHVVRD